MPTQRSSVVDTRGRAARDNRGTTLICRVIKLLRALVESYGSGDLRWYVGLKDALRAGSPLLTVQWPSVRPRRSNNRSSKRPGNIAF